MNQESKLTIDDICHSMALEFETKGAAVLDEFVTTYPRHKQELCEWGVYMVVCDVLEGQPFTRLNPVFVAKASKKLRELYLRASVPGYLAHCENEGVAPVEDLWGEK